MENNYKQTLFDEYRKMIPELKGLENERKRLLSSMILVQFLIISMVSILSYFFIHNNMSALLPFIFIAGAIILCAFSFSADCQFAKKYKNDLKNICFERILEVFGFIKNSPTYSIATLNKHIQQEKDYKIIIDDCFEGLYKEVNFRIAEIKNAMVESIHGIYSGPWSGILFEIKFNKKINTPIRILPKSDKSNLFMIAGGIFFIIIGLVTFAIPILIFALLWTGLLIFTFVSSKFKKVNLEDVNFTKKYNVEATDQIEARYILTPSFMERLEDLKTAFKSNDIRVFFENDVMTIVIGTGKDLFEIGDLYCSIYSFQQIEQFYNEITAIIEMIDHFKLGEKTGL